MSRIVRVEIGRHDYDVVGEFKFFKPGPDGRVTRASVLVRITDDEGNQGWGQSVPAHTWTYETLESIETTLRGYLAGAILGADPCDLEEVHRRMGQAIRPAFSTGQPLCKAGIDLACHDLAGKKSGQPVHALLGEGALDAITLSWTVASPDMAVVESQLEQGRERGYRNFNIKVGAPQSPEYDLELTRKVRDFSPDGFLWADANTGYDLETALDLLPKLADLGAAVMESPLPPANLRGYQALRRQGALPIIMDEGIVSPLETEEFIELGMLDGIAMKTVRCAGLWPCRKIVELLKSRGLMILGSGLTDADLTLAASAHLFAWAGIERPCALNGPQYLQGFLSGGQILPKADRLAVPQGPGLGLVLGNEAESALEKLAEL